MEKRTKHYFQKLFVRKFAGERLYQKIKFFKIYCKAKLGTDYEISRILLEILKEDDVFFDVGANLGQYIIRIKSKYNEGVQVYAFEPVKSSFVILSKYIKKNCHNVVLENYAVSDSSGFDTLYIPIIDNIQIDTQASIDLDNRKMYYSEFVKQEIKKITIDKFVQEKSVLRMDYMKIDTEGNDERVIKGALGTIAEYSPVIFCEDMENEETLDVLSRLKYSRYLLAKNYTLLNFSDAQPNDVFNDIVIFIPESKKSIFNKYYQPNT